jgi:hypothetical protein
MSQPFDNVFKENLEIISLTLIKSLLEIPYTSLEELPDDLQVTLERRPDFLKLVRSGDAPFILQLEIQTVDDSKMVYRLQEYCGLLSRKYELDVRQ